MGLLLAVALRSIVFAAVSPELCAVCSKPLTEIYYNYEDKVTLEKAHVCKDCEKSLPECFVCGLPANTNSVGFTVLADQRVLCARDAATAVVRESDGLRISAEVRDSLDRLFSRFTTFPETNVTFALVDRIHLMTLFKRAGNDYQCPNVWGMTDIKTNRYRRAFHVSLINGLPLSWFQATCAHEYTHAWVAEHLSQTRKGVLSQDAEEGFCELIAFLFMESMNNEAQKALILRNAYTRGQIDLFVAAEREYGLNEVLDWMQYGTDDRLSVEDPARIRRISLHAATRVASQRSSAATPPRQPDTLVLKAVFWDPKRPLALINDHTFAPNEESKVHLGGTNVVVRCLTILPNSVHLHVAGSDCEQILQLKAK
jgi:hypothetical protein